MSAADRVRVTGGALPMRTAVKALPPRAALHSSGVPGGGDRRGPPQQRTAARCLQDLDPQAWIVAEAAIEGDELGVHRARLSSEERIGDITVGELA
jgi:hypothetical protein